MRGLLKAAKHASGNDRTCYKCPLGYTRCTPENIKTCHIQFIKGFTKGARWFKKSLWHDASNKTPRKGSPLLLFLSNETMALGEFADGVYHYSVPEDSLLSATEVLAFLYIVDLLP